ncbi:hypothetical protein PG999_014363 [Apiospora kogelbergensis]|uniref:Uncharacterized protein n=1 Tax=Apiospora kogelbergensis TaxID=1337665 RepID=A0AAW0QB79_9PEZI
MIWFLPSLTTSATSHRKRPLSHIPAPLWGTPLEAQLEEADQELDGHLPKRPFSELHWVRVGHCVEVLAFRWMEPQGLPLADFQPAEAVRQPRDP